MSEITMPEFAHHIETRRASGYEFDTDPAVLTIHSHVGEMAIRQEGAVVLEAWLKKGRHEVPTMILTSDIVDDPYSSHARIAKLGVGSHTMSPVGPSEGFGGQHGFARWATYTSEKVGDSKGILRAETPPNYFKLTKEFEIGSDGIPALDSTIRLQNKTGKRQFTSAGEHFYFPLPDGDAEGLIVNSPNGDAPMNDPELRDLVMSGQAQFWPGFTGDNIGIDFPDGRKILISGSATILESDGAKTNVDHQLGMLFWHRPGTESICIEPTVGFAGIENPGTASEKVRNQELELPIGATMILGTKIELIS